MRRLRLLLVVCSALLLLQGAAGSRLHLHTPKVRPLDGTVLLLTQDDPTKDRTSPERSLKGKRWLKLKTAYGENVLVLEGQTGDFSKISSGDKVTIEGVWLSRGAGGVRAVSGFTRAEATYCFVGTSIKKAERKARPGPRTVFGPKLALKADFPPPPVMNGSRALRAAASTAPEQAWGSAVSVDSSGMHVIRSALWEGLGPAGNALPPRAAGGATDAGAAAVDAGAAATLPSAKIVTNQLIKDKLDTMIIPLGAYNQDGATACPGTQLPKWDVATLRRNIFQEEPGAAAITVGGTFNKCSYGKSKFDKTTSFVADLVRLPCSGTSNGVAWTFSKCDFDDFNGWADAADAEIRKRFAEQKVTDWAKYNLANYRYRVYLLPPSPCFWVGLGYVGCDGSWDCRAWIAGDFWLTPQAIVHEMGHNMYMGHAGMYRSADQFDEYGDGTCPMGYCCQIRCQHVAHSWQMGWAGVQQLDPGDIPPGTTVSIKLAPLAVPAKAPFVAGVRINATWISGLKGESLFVAYRALTAGTPDTLLDLAAFANKVHIYSTAIANTWDASLTTYKAAIAYNKNCATAKPPCSWAVPNSDLVIRATSTASTGATISICRKVTGGKETKDTCLRKVDGDCNGAVNTSDTACKKLLPIKRRRPGMKLELSKLEER